MKLYHGTIEKIKDEYLKVHKAFKNSDYEEWVHLTPNYEIALLYSVNPIRAYYKGKVKSTEIPAFSTHLKFSDNPKKPHKIYEIYPNMLSELFNTTAYIYICEVDEKDISNPHDSNFERIVSKNVKIEKEIIIPNVLAELTKLNREGKIEIIYHNYFSKSDAYYCNESVECKASLAETQWEADFYYDKFSDKQNVINSIPDNLKHK